MNNTRPFIFLMPHTPIFFLDKYRVEIITDSMFLCNCMHKWINKWKCNGWRNKKGNTVANKYMLEQLDSRLRAMDSVKFVCYYQFISQYYNNQKS